MEESSRKVADALSGLAGAGEVVEFPEPMPTAAAAAAQLGCPVGAIANSLVFSAGDEPVLVVASGAHRVDVKVVARLLDVPKIRRASREFVLEHTGQEVGGVAPIGHPKPLRAVVDTALQQYETVWAGGGSKHTMLSTTFGELVRLTAGIPAEIAEQPR